MFPEISQSHINLHATEFNFTLFLEETIKRPISLDFSENPSVVLGWDPHLTKKTRNKSTTHQAGLLINQNGSCWLTNLGPDASTEVFRPKKSIYRCLAYNQVAYVCDGDYIGLQGHYFRLAFEKHYLHLQPVPSEEIDYLRIH